MRRAEMRKTESQEMEGGWRRLQRPSILFYEQAGGLSRKNEFLLWNDGTR